ncbi:MAG: rhamnulokinase [Clostridiaceae bacterium]|nr:rhamnulokinase [Clostridiaceae bacterium]
MATSGNSAVEAGCTASTIVSHHAGRLHTCETYRFANEPTIVDESLTWDIDRLFHEVKQTIAATLREFPTLTSLSIDTWGVDYVLMRGDEPIYPCYAYRDSRTEATFAAVHSLIPPEALYARTGIQQLPMNTIYQLYDDKLRGRLTPEVTDFLMMPEYFLYRLTGIKAKEYTIASTSGLLNARSRQFDSEIVAALGLPERLFPEVRQPGFVLGKLLPEVAAEVGGQAQVLFCPTHDTASAVEGIPMDIDAPFLSSGTWSLLGVKLDDPRTDVESRTAGFTNEGGVGYIRYLKNITGMWIFQCLCKELGLSFAQIEESARSSQFKAIFDVNDPRFTAPVNMRAEIVAALGIQELDDADLLSSVYHSLAHCYRETLTALECNAGRNWDRLYIVGGGAKNKYLNELTAEYTGKRVIVLPIEATALGNIVVQSRTTATKMP